MDLGGRKSKRAGGKNVLAMDESAPDERVGLHQAAGQYDSLQ
jgi:hypothetical protein